MWPTRQRCQMCHPTLMTCAGYESCQTGAGMNLCKSKKPWSILDPLSSRLGPCPLFRSWNGTTNTCRLHLNRARESAKKIILQHLLIFVAFSDKQNFISITWITLFIFKIFSKLSIQGKGWFLSSKTLIGIQILSQIKALGIDLEQETPLYKVQLIPAS